MEIDFNMEFRDDNMLISSAGIRNNNINDNNSYNSNTDEDDDIHMSDNGTCDLPAKALFMHMKQYNGENGCQKCKIKGKREGGVQTYPHQVNLELRTEEETIRQARRATSKNPVCGVKGPTILTNLVYKWIRTTTIDPMHCVFLGVFKSLLMLWFYPSHAGERFSIYDKVDDVDKLIKKIKVPQFVQRRLRSIKEHLKYWKASELKVFFFHVSLVVLEGILMPAYFEHFKLLVAAIYLLSQRSISEDMLNNADRMIIEFSARFAFLYHARNMTNNLHSMRHFVQDVRDIGPLYVYSCFTYEDINGKLKN
ncbi:uncharacterized protein LOC122503876 [Leptopilina heterotoma]|uniref:uncharacterized protein LOC122503876 n=1 Tax=Leptopilina heterotoma TaxID=63436 RepID=UPI001CA7EDCC|nr:uncharacterized protein LOC122503876 [Leptopilina heterotoma]